MAQNSESYYGEPSKSYESSDNENFDGSSDELNESADDSKASNEHDESSDQNDEPSNQQELPNQNFKSPDCETKTPQKLSIQLLDQKKITLYCKSENDDRDLTMDEVIESIVEKYNSFLVKQNKKKEKIPTYTLQKRCLSGSGPYKQKTYTLSLSYNTPLAVVSDDNPKEDANSHRILFFFKEEPYPIIFALTSGQAFKVVKLYVDYSFPIKVVEKIGDPRKIIKSERRHLFGEKIKEIVYTEIKYEHDRECTLELYYFVEMIMCQIKCKSSLETLLEELLQPVKKKQLQSKASKSPEEEKRRKGGNKITARTAGMLKIERRIHIFDYPRILDLLIKYQLDEKTCDASNNEEEADPEFSFLHFPAVANRRNGELNDHLMREIFCRSQEDTSDIKFYVRHKFLEDFLFSNKFEIQISKGKNYKKMGERPPTLEEIILEINEPTDEEEFVKKFSRSKLRFCDSKNADIIAPLISYIEGELSIGENSYFKLRNMWYELTADYTAYLHRDFKNLIHTSLIRCRNNVMFLPRPWEEDENEDVYNQAYLKAPYGPENGYLVFDCILNKDNIECCDILKYTKSTIYLYHVKKDFGQHTRVAASQILNAAKLIRSSISLKQAETYLQRLWDCATMKTPRNRDLKNIKYYDDVKEAIEASFKNVTEFINLFSRLKVVFVYAYCPTRNNSLKNELNKYYVTHKKLTCVPPESREALFEKLVELEYLNQFGDLTGKFCFVKKSDFDLGDQFNNKKGKIFGFLKKYRPSSKSTIGKLELVQVANDLKKIGFDFRICEIDRAESSISEPEKTESIMF